MFVTELAGPKDTDESSVANPDWERIEAAILALNGDDCTMVCLGTGEEVPHLCIGGGENQQYIAYMTYDNETFYTLVNNDAPDTEIELVCGGQRSEYAARLVVDLPTVLAAAKAFAETGKVAPDLSWEQDA